MAITYERFWKVKVMEYLLIIVACTLGCWAIKDSSDIRELRERVKKLKGGK